MDKTARIKKCFPTLERLGMDMVILKVCQLNDVERELLDEALIHYDAIIDNLNAILHPKKEV